MRRWTGFSSLPEYSIDLRSGLNEAPSLRPGSVWTKRSSRVDVKVWKRHLQLRSRLERGGLDVTLLPLNVSHVKESEVVF